MKIELKNLLSACILGGLSIFFIMSLIVIYTTTKDSIAESFDEKMSGIGDSISSMVSAADLRDILNTKETDFKNSPLFMKYYAPLSKTLTDTNATFIYLFLYGGDKDILYIVDGTPMEEGIWAPPNTSESSVDEDLKQGLINAFRFRGCATELIDDTQWGLMKSGTYPIPDGDGRSFYMTGVDMGIGSILTRAAAVLTKVGGVFVLISIIAIFAASAVAVSIAKSVEAVKNEVLRIGAGGETQINLKRAPAEMREIAAIVSKNAGDVSAQLKSISKSCAKISHDALASRLNSHLSSSDGDFEFCASSDSNDSDSFCAAVEIGKNFFAWSFARSKSDCKNILKNSAVLNLASAGDVVFDDPAGACKAFAKFDAKGEKLFSSGEAIDAEFKFDSDGKIKSAKFAFLDGTVISGCRKEFQ